MKSIFWIVWLKLGFKSSNTVATTKSYNLNLMGNIPAPIFKLKQHIQTQVNPCEYPHTPGEITYDGHVMEHSTIYPAFIKLGLVLGEANVIQPS